MLKNASAKSYYRPDIDGLRAVAIIPVVLFHAGIMGFSGGFVGVDIFFVISGYLITSIIFREMKKGAFSLLNFWERRIKRILPALSIVTATSLIASYFIVLYTEDFMEFGQSIVAQSMFLANIFFMRESGYFAAPAEAMPMLHTWSLSVEEQFYVLFPLLLLCLFFYLKKYITHALILLFVASLGYSVWMTNIVSGEQFSIFGVGGIWGGALNATAAFYILPARMWELLLGAILAISVWEIRSKGLAELLSFAGFTAIIIAVITIDSNTPFPGLVALIPTIGAALLILANTNHETYVRKLLSLPAFVFIGLISYSLYLWHWPLFTLSKIYFQKSPVNDFSYPEYFVLILASVGLSYLTYRFIETPARTAPLERKYVYGLAAITLALFIIVGYSFSTKSDARSLNENAESLRYAIGDYGPKLNKCLKNVRFGEGKENVPCFINADSSADVSFVVWGDSHAHAMLGGIEKAAHESDIKGAFFAFPACTPILDVKVDPKQPICERLKEEAISFIRENGVKDIIIIARWSSTIAPYRRNGSTNHMLLDARSVEKTATDSERVLKEKLQAMADLFATEKRNIHLVRQVPYQLDYYPRSSFYEAVHEGDAYVFPTVEFQRYAKEQGTENAIIDTVSNLNVIDPSSYLCNETECFMELDGKVLYRNADHLSGAGALYITPLFKEVFDGLK